MNKTKGCLIANFATVPFNIRSDLHQSRLCSILVWALLQKS
nr:hypothetical protein [Escherichia coli]